MEGNLLRILVILVGVALAAIILIQQPKDGSMGGSFGGGGGGASGTIFGARGATSFFFKLTGGLAIVFTVLIVLLIKVTNSGYDSVDSVTDRVSVSTPQTTETLTTPSDNTIPQEVGETESTEVVIPE